MNCKNCNAEVFLNYCPSCGQRVQLKRIDGHYIIHELIHLFHFEKGILYTIRELFMRPGDSVRQFLIENRYRLVKPIIFIIVTSLFYSLVNYFLHFEDGYINYSNVDESTSKSILKWIQGNYGYANIIMGIFIAFWTKLFFRKYQFNFFEILILLCYAMGVGMIIFAFFGMLQSFTHFNLMQIGGVVGFLYCTWAIGQFFDKGKFVNYVKAFFAYFLGVLTFTLTAILIGNIIDLILY